MKNEISDEEIRRKIKRLIVLKETAGAWSDEDHLELATLEDIDRWVENIRLQWQRDVAG
jgi:hypothetical protein